MPEYDALAESYTESASQTKVDSGLQTDSGSTADVEVMAQSEGLFGSLAKMAKKAASSPALQAGAMAAMTGGNPMQAAMGAAMGGG